MNPPPRMDISFPPIKDINLEYYPIVTCAKIGGHDVCTIPITRALGAVPSTAHGMMKFLIRAGVATIISERSRPLEIQMVHQPIVPPSRIEFVKVVIHPEYLEQTVMLGGGLCVKS
nr:hypothetical protein [Tanacetum cinerariifolium]